MTPTLITYPSGSTITLNVTNADNLLVGYLAESPAIRRQIYGRMTDYGITFKDSIDIGASLHGDNNTLTLIGTNFTGGGQIAFTILVGAAVKATVNVNLSEYTCQVWAYQFQQA